MSVFRIVVIGLIIPIAVFGKAPIDIPSFTEQVVGLAMIYLAPSLLLGIIFYSYFRLREKYKIKRKLWAFKVAFIISLTTFLIFFISFFVTRLWGKYDYPQAPDVVTGNYRNIL